ncbi:peptide-methionine (S)-S-oxide reductase [Segetibacter sp. 3557_3]|uniref:peptide-methionine (S)-S-oxide reductase MsrA n=1 Tax=Segetibacter sp. 3557_3 TaxID=2547429 RepID=UPI0010589813|nr:peptide-methionine (S)-S-oxide reductase MsrA [Segetibacter sp. 3557_3]TDH26881.1 peptide-methionine (S)-S-oxide reductase [Segetibacter sp. 3557_3]
MNVIYTALFAFNLILLSCNNITDVAAANQSKSSVTETKTDTATLGAGCFWCVEAVFQQLDGVLKVSSGYTGGHVPNPTYEQVCTKTTGHVEVCQVVFDPAKITYDELLEVFWKTHDPTTPDQQGNDLGPQYRSAIFYHNNEQRHKAEGYKASLEQSGAFSAKIVTTVEPLKTFYIAENYHQDYYNSNPNQMYCRYVIQPKMEKFEKVFKDKLKKSKTE